MGRQPRARIERKAWPSVVYAIGDVHGCYDHLLRLEARIVEDARSYSGEKLVVMLGDYVDRGPQSAAVIGHLLAPPPAGFDRLCLSGNHDDLMDRALSGDGDDEAWLEMGGNATLASYGLEPRRLVSASAAQRRRLLLSHVPPAHAQFLAGLPISLSLPGVTFVHAGLRPGRPLASQPDRDLLWLRPDDAEDANRTTLVVHGHTPAPKPVNHPYRICVDTAAFAGGSLTAVRLTADGSRHFISA